MIDPAHPPPATDWHALDAERALAALDARATGLDESEVAERLERFGPNALPAAPPRSLLRRLGDQFHNLLIYVLLGAAVLATAIGHILDALVVLGVVLVNAAIGLVQEGRAERALDAIRKLMDPQTSVLRNGRRVRLRADRLVPGDIVLLEAGDRVPADLRLIQALGLRVEEAALTGESIPVDKQAGAVAADAALGERGSMAYSGTLVVAGHGRGVVAATGSASELGRIGNLLGSVQMLRTPLLRKMDAFSRRITGAILVAGIGLLAYAVLVTGRRWDEAFMIVVGFAVAAIPEGLPAVMTITLAVGVQRMAARHAVIRNLPAVETLGSVSVICSDKTGTLTRNEMMVVAIDAGDGSIDVQGEGYRPSGRLLTGATELDSAALQALAALARAACLCNDAELDLDEGHVQIHGDPMEAALLALAGKLGHPHERVRAANPRIDAVPFDARHRYMATLNRTPDGSCLAMLKGAPEQVLQMCRRQHAPAAARFDPADWQRRAETLAARGLRVLALAERHLPDPSGSFGATVSAGGFTLLGLVGLIDPPRGEAREAVAECRSAGIEVKMITGDHAGTAAAIARELGMHREPTVVVGAELDAMDAEALLLVARTASVFARTSPEHKLRLVQALQEDGRVVAMTGDGVNDAPALKRADVGVAMGQGGTEAAKAAAEMVLTDDNFATIVAAVREGRTVYDNLTKVIAWTLPTNGGEALVILIAVVLGLTLPVTPVQILWVNMVTAVALGLTLAFEPTEPGVMRRPPRPAGESLLQARLLWRIGFVSVLFVTAIFSMFHWAQVRQLPIEAARTMVVNTLVVLEIFYLFSVRYVHGASITWRGVLGTPAVLLGVATVTALQFAFTYVPIMQTLFGTRGLSFTDGIAIVGCGVAMLLVVEAEKWLLDRLPRSRTTAAGQGP
ncbi:MAG TPA: HAD-IC family P-type ATPase [Xanthomonadaceae bacterium]|nr:HAD-IC family P-type ATPase [Xanthomonadaceae bacterium]